MEDQGECSADSYIAVGGERMDGQECLCGRSENGGAGVGVSFLNCVYGGDGFLFGEPEDWILVEQCVGGGCDLRSFGLRIHVLGGDAAIECEARAVFVGSGDHGGDYAHCVRGIADLVEHKEGLVRKSQPARDFLTGPRGVVQRNIYYVTYISYTVT